MPNMFGSGPMKKALKLLANEVWEERSVLLASYVGEAESGWGRKGLESNKRATLSVGSPPILTSAQPAAE